MGDQFKHKVAQHSVAGINPSHHYTVITPSHLESLTLACKKRLEIIDTAFVSKCICDKIVFTTNRLA